MRAEKHYVTADYRTRQISLLIFMRYYHRPSKIGSWRVIFSSTIPHLRWTQDLGLGSGEYGLDVS